MPPTGLSGRILDVKNGLQARLRLPRLTNVAFGRMLARYMGREEDFGGNTVKQWIDGDRVPDLEVLEAIAALGNVDPGDLTYGSDRTLSVIDPSSYLQLTTENTPPLRVARKKNAARSKGRRG